MRLSDCLSAGSETFGEQTSEEIISNGKNHSHEDIHGGVIEEKSKLVPAWELAAEKW